MCASEQNYIALANLTLSFINLSVMILPFLNYYFNITSDIVSVNCKIYYLAVSSYES